MGAPLLANITGLGQTPLFALDELREAGVAMALYPLSAFRAMNKAAEAVYTAIRRDGHLRAVLDLMQTREELYEAHRLSRVRAAAGRAVRQPIGQFPNAGSRRTGLIPWLGRRVGAAGLQEDRRWVQ